MELFRIKIERWTMTIKAQQAVKRDIADRLSKIAFHFEERNRIRATFEQCTLGDLFPDSLTAKMLERLLTRVQSEELTTLLELVHLIDNMRKHLNLHQLDATELKVIEKSEPYRVATNFVNVHKHGSRGRNKRSAHIDYTVPILVQKGKKPQLSDKLIDIRSMINFEGDLFDSIDVIEKLIHIWEKFLRDHTEIDLRPFSSRIGVVLQFQHGQAQYSAKMPHGVLVDAKAKADERKHIDL